MKKYKLHYVCFDCRKSFKQPLIEDIIIQNGDMPSYKEAYSKYDSIKSKNFRERNPELIERFERQYRNKKYKCPDCGKEMKNVGHDLKAPKREKIKEWEILRGMYRVGHQFHSCGCYGPGLIPKSRKEYLVYLQKAHSRYRNMLEKRGNNLTGNELGEYLQYWKERLALINSELIENQH